MLKIFSSRVPLQRRQAISLPMLKTKKVLSVASQSVSQASNRARNHPTNSLNAKKINDCAIPRAHATCLCQQTWGRVHRHCPGGRGSVATHEASLRPPRRGVSNATPTNPFTHIPSKPTNPKSENKKNKKEQTERRLHSRSQNTPFETQTSFQLLAFVCAHQRRCEAQVENRKR